MVLIDRIREKRQQVDGAAAQIAVCWPPVGRQTNAQQYFQAWMMKDILLPSGKVRTKRVYCGPYYMPDLKPGVWALNKYISFVLALACCVLLYEASAVSRSAGNRWFIYIPQVLCLLGCFTMVCFTGAKAVTKEKLMLSELRDAVTRLLPSALCTGALFAAATVVMLLYALISGITVSALLSVACTLAAAVFSILIFFMEYRVDYIHVFNEFAPAELNPERE